MHHPQPELMLESIEVAVALKKFVSCSQTERRNEAVDGLADGEPSATQEVIVLSGRQGKLTSAGFENGEPVKVAPKLMKCGLTADALKNLAVNQIGKSYGLSAELTVQPQRLNTRLPSHRTFPRHLRMPACSWV